MTKHRREVPTPPKNLKPCCRSTFLDAVAMGRRLGRWEGYEIGVDVGFLKLLKEKEASKPSGASSPTKAGADSVMPERADIEAG